MLLSDREYLRLIASGLMKDVVPELTSRGAQSTAAIAINALKELINRNASLPRIVAEFAPGGLALLERLTSLGDRAGAPRDPAADAVRRTLVDGKGDQHQPFSDLVAVLDRGARQLSAARPAGQPQLNADISHWLKDVAEWELAYYTAFANLPAPEIEHETGQVQRLTREKLEAQLRDRLPELGALEIRDFAIVPGGFSNEIYFFTLHPEFGEDRQLVIRKNAARPFFSFWAHRAREEFEIVRRVHAAGLPVPQPLWLFKDMPDVDGDYYVATRGLGRMIGTLSGASEAVPEELLLNLAEFLARLHGIPLQNFADYIAVGDTPVAVGDTAHDAVRKNVDYLHRAWLSSSRLPAPTEAFIIDWLRNNVPANPNPPVLVHADCFVHNFLVTGTEITTVVDWEAAHFGDPAEDLAYIKGQVSELMDWDRFLDHYWKCGGQPIDQSSFPYYDCLLNFRNVFGTNIGVARIPAGYSDIRMIPLGSEFFTRFMRSCVEGTR